MVASALNVKNERTRLDFKTAYFLQCLRIIYLTF